MKKNSIKVSAVLNLRTADTFFVYTVAVGYFLTSTLLSLSRLMLRFTLASMVLARTMSVMLTPVALSMTSKLCLMTVGTAPLMPAASAPLVP